MGGLIVCGGFLFAALVIRSEYRRGEIGILAGRVRFAIYAAIFGILVCIVGFAIGGLDDMVRLMGG